MSTIVIGMLLLIHYYCYIVSVCCSMIGRNVMRVLHFGYVMYYMYVLFEYEFIMCMSDSEYEVYYLHAWFWAGYPLFVSLVLCMRFIIYYLYAWFWVWETFTENFEYEREDRIFIVLCIIYDMCICIL